MLNNLHPDPLMQECLAEAEQGESIYTKEQEEEIRAMLLHGIVEGKDFNKIYKQSISQTYPLPEGKGLFKSYYRLRELYAEETKKYKKAVNVDREILWEQLYTRYQELFDNEGSKHDIVGQKKVLDSMLRLLSAAAQERALNKAEEDDKNITYVLDFSL